MGEPAGELGYAEALVELEGIIAELEGDFVDVDHLAERVRRAKELIELCRARIATARMEVRQVVSEMAPPGSPSEPAVDDRE